MPTPAGRAASGLRADAESNRRDIVTAAREVFAEQGIDAPLGEVARRAGVGIATLYRRFPSRSDLVADAFGEKISQYADAAEAALQADDPWDGFSGFITAATQMQAVDRGFAEVVTSSISTAPHFEAERQRAYSGLLALIARARDSGDLRADFVAEDLILVLLANAGVLSALGHGGPRAADRLLAYLLQSFRAQGAAPAELPAPLTAAETYSALRRFERSTSGGPASR